MNTFRKIALATCFVFTHSACSLNMKIFGAKTSLSSDSPVITAVKGQFPLGDPKFGTKVKKFLTTVTGQRFAFEDTNQKITVTTDTGKVLSTFAVPNASQILGLTADADGNLLLTGVDGTDTNIRFLRKFTVSGSYLGELVTFTLENAILPLPKNPVVGSDGSIYVSVFDEIRKYTASGSFVLTFGLGSASSPLLDGEIPAPPAFVVNSDGTLWAVDDQTTRLQKFATNGHYDSQITWPQQIGGSHVNSIVRETDGTFTIIELLGNSSYMTHFDSTGAILWTTNGTDAGRIFQNEPKIEKYNNKYYVTDLAVIYTYALDGTYLTKDVQTLNTPYAATRATDGSFFVASNSGITKFSAKGELEKTFGTVAIQTGVVVDSHNYVYAVNFTDHGQMFKYDLDGNLQQTITIPGSYPYALAIDKADNIYLADPYAGVFKIDATTRTASPFATADVAMGAGVACASDGSIYILDFDGAAMSAKKFNSSGVLLNTFANAGSGALTFAQGIAVSSAGTIYIADSSTNRVLVFDKDRNFSTSFGTAGAGANQFSQPLGIYIDAFDNVYVSDSQNNAVKKFTAAGIPSLD